MMVIEGKEAIARVDWQRVRTIIAEAGLNERDVQQLEQAVPPEYLLLVWL